MIGSRSLQSINILTSQMNDFQMDECEPSFSLSPKEIYIKCINDLLSNEKLTSNSSALLYSMIYEKDDDFFTAILIPIGNNSFTIDHLTDILDSKVNRELEILFSNCSYEEAKSASLDDRHTNNLTSKSLTYGEVSFSSFLEIMNNFNKLLENHNNRLKRGTFYDLGSGSGRAVFTARFTQDYSRCIGLELMGNLHVLAENIKEKYYDNSYDQRLNFSSPCDIELHNADISEYDWTDGDVIFGHSTCFGKELLGKVLKKSRGLKSGSYMILLSEMPNSMDIYFELVDMKRCFMTWGESDVSYYRRR